MMIVIFANGCFWKRFQTGDGRPAAKEIQAVWQQAILETLDAAGYASEIRIGEGLAETVCFEIADGTGDADTIAAAERAIEAGEQAAQLLAVEVVRSSYGFYQDEK